MCKGLKQNESTESREESMSRSGLKLFDVLSSKLFKVKLSTFVLLHLQQCHITLKRPR